MDWAWTKHLQVSLMDVVMRIKLDWPTSGADWLSYLFKKMDQSKVDLQPLNNPGQSKCHQLRGLLICGFGSNIAYTSALWPSSWVGSIGLSSWDGSHWWIRRLGQNSESTQGNIPTKFQANPFVLGGRLFCKRYWKIRHRRVVEWSPQVSLSISLHRVRTEKKQEKKTGDHQHPAHQGRWRTLSTWHLSSRMTCPSLCPSSPRDWLTQSPQSSAGSPQSFLPSSSP